MLANTIQSIMTTNVATLPLGSPLRAAVDQMSEKNISCVIISADRKPLGIITERDILRIYAQHLDMDKTKVDDVMRSPVKTISQNMDFYEAAIYLHKNSIRRIIIVDKEGRLKGLVTQTDLKNHLGGVYYLKLKTIESVMTREVITAEFDDKLSAVIDRMYERNLSCIVISKNNAPVGILTERDVLHFMAGGENITKRPVSSVIKRPLVTISPDASIFKATHSMKHMNIRRLVVVGEDNELLGLLTEGDIVKHLETIYLESLRNIVESDRTYVNAIKEGIFESSIGIDGIFTWINDAGARILGYSSPEKILGKNLKNVFVEEDGLQKLLAKLKGGKAAHDFSTVIKRPSGTRKYIEGTFYYIKDEDGKVTCMQGTLRDITERKKIEDKIKQKVAEQTVEIRKKSRELEKLNTKLQEMSVQDGLTGINNFRYFSEMLEIEFKKACRYNLPLACIILDIDDFKFINDRFGHAAGDLALIKTARLLKSSVRETDIVTRYGGDEFTIILPNTGLPNALAVGTKILEAFRKYELKRDEVSLGKISLSIGISALPDEHIDSAQALVEAADKAMYRAKAGGKNNVCTTKDTDKAALAGG